MSDLIAHVRWLLILLRDQCMPATISQEPGALDYVIVSLVAISVLGGTIWFARGLTRSDSPHVDALKAKVLED